MVILITMFANVIFPLSAPGTYTYRIKPEQTDQIKIGSRVLAEFGKKNRFGFVMGLSAADDVKHAGRLKEIIEPIPVFPFFTEQYVKFITWLSDYYMAQPGDVLRTALPAALLRYIEKHPPIEEPFSKSNTASFQCSQLTDEQDTAFKIIRESILNNLPRTFLLHGVTSSGKSHVYYELAKETLKAGKTVLIMVPEISLTPQTVRNFTDIFTDSVAVFHSGLTDKERIKNWLRIFSGNAPVVVGVRSVLFTPLRNLGLIVVDEEHDSSYCDDDRSFSFNARDAAVVRGGIEGASVVLGSATPSILSRHNADSGKYNLLSLNKRYNDMPMPVVFKVDMREERTQNNWSIFSRVLQEKMTNTLEDGKQIILLKNRRGFAHFLQCQGCGYIPVCKNCNVSLTFHKTIGRLVCHYCNSRIDMPPVCPECKGVRLKPSGAGVEKVEEDLKKLIPHARILRLDMDTGSKRGSTEKILADFRNKKADVLIGTQMVSKGLDFPDVTLVGIILADTGLFMPDFHAAERTFQLLTQVAGRSGRGGTSGRSCAPNLFPKRKINRIRSGT